VVMTTTKTETKHIIFHNGNLKMELTTNDFCDNYTSMLRVYTDVLLLKIVVQVTMHAFDGRTDGQISHHHSALAFRWRWALPRTLLGKLTPGPLRGEEGGKGKEDLR